jgi:hypothetical protein
VVHVGSDGLQILVASETFSVQFCCVTGKPLWASILLLLGLQILLGDGGIGVGSETVLEGGLAI